MSYYLPFEPEIELGQPYGARPGMFPNPPKGHNGDDWLTPTGTPVRAAGDGVVVFAGQFDSTYADNFGWNLNYGGLMVVLNMDGNNAPYFEYGHNSKLLVRTGDRVRAGQVIALTGATDGNTGVITGPHCHVGALPPNFDLNDGSYGRVNPRIYMTQYWDNGLNLNYYTSTEQDFDMASLEDIRTLIRQELALAVQPGIESERNAGPLYELNENIKWLRETFTPGESGKRQAGEALRIILAAANAQ
jgi:hypothetical protein